MNRGCEIRGELDASMFCDTGVHCDHCCDCDDEGQDTADDLDDDDGSIAIPL